MGANDPAPKCNLDSRFDFTMQIYKIKFPRLETFCDEQVCVLNLCIECQEQIVLETIIIIHQLLSWFSTLQKGTTKVPTKTKIHIRLSGASEKSLKWQISHVLPFYTICLIYELNGQTWSHQTNFPLLKFYVHHSTSRAGALLHS